MVPTVEQPGVTFVTCDTCGARFDPRQPFLHYCIPYAAPSESGVRTCDACGDELWGAVHKCGPKDWAAETNRLLRQLHEDRIKDLVRQEVAAVMSRRESA